MGPNIPFEANVFSDLLPYQSFDSHSDLYHNQDTAGFILKGSPIAGARLDDQALLAQFLQNKEMLPPGTSLQFLLVASPFVGGWFDRWKNLRKGEVYQDLAERCSEYLQGQTFHEKEGNILRTFDVYISLTTPSRIKDVSAENQLIHVRDQLVQALQGIGIYTKNLRPQEFLQDFNSWLGLSGSAHQIPTSWNTFEPISRSFSLADQFFTNTPESIQTERGFTFTGFVPNKYPKHWALCLMDGFLGDLFEPRPLSCPYWIHYGLTITEGQDGQKTHAFATRESMDSAIKSGLRRWIPDLDERAEEANELVRDVQGGAQFAISGLSCGIWAPQENRARILSQFTNMWSNLGFSMNPTHYHHLPMLVSMMPMTWTMGAKSGGLLSGAESYGYGKSGFIYKLHKKTITKEAQNMLPLVAEWKGQGVGGVPLVGRRGQLFDWSPFGSGHNFNGWVFGQSGSGKSVFMQVLMLYVLSIGGRAFVLDYGRSFEKICKILGGQFIEFDVKRPVSLNPFSRIPTGTSVEDVDDRERMLATLKPIIQVMAAPRQGTTDLQAAYLEEAIRAVWKAHQNKATITDIRDYLMKRPEQDAKDLGQMLYSYCREGVYGKFFDGPAAVKLDEPLVVIETDDLRNHPSLMAVVVQMMIVQVNQTMANGDRKQPFLIMIDEAWQLLKGKDSAEFISGSSRTTRKYNGGIWCGTQHVTDCFKEDSPAATEAFNCSAWKCLLYQEPDVIDALSSHDQLKQFVSTDALKRLLKSVHSKPPHYSEVAIFGPHVNGVVGRLKLDPFSRLLFSTNAEEFARIKDYRDQGYALPDAIEQVLRDIGEVPPSKGNVAA